MSDELKEIIEEIEEYEILRPEKIEIDLYDINKTTLQSQLLINTDINFSYTMENRTYEYRFIEPIYISSISIKSKADDLKGMNVTVVDVDNKDIVFVLDNYKRYTFPRIDVRKVIKGFKITPRKIGKKDPKINLEKIEVYGYEISKYDDLKKQASALAILNHSLKDEAKKVLDENTKLLSKIEEESKNLESLHEELDDSIDKLKEDLKVLKAKEQELDNEISNKKQSLDSLEKNISKLRKDIGELKSQEQLLKDSIQQKEASIQSLNTKISHIETELKEAESNRNLIAYDIQEYVENANKDIQLYIALSIIPWGLIAIVTIMILGGSADLTTVLKVEKDAQIWAIFWSRIPFVIAAGTVLFVAYEISNIFVRRIIEIHQQKLDFAKIGIIAKDVSDTSTDGLDLSDKEKFELRTKLKMDMLKNHLSRELGKQYDCKINPNVWQKWKDMMSLKQKSAEAIEVEKVTK